MKSIINLLRNDPDNIGDRYSTPFHYFLEGPRWTRDVGETPKETEILVVGGGGMFHFPNLEHHIRAAKTAILWGIGLNNHETHHDRNIPGWVGEAKLVGLRDWGTPWPWVPCASCMLSDIAILRSAMPVQAVVQYDHHLYGMPGIEGVPRMTNKERDILKVLAFLASGETVLTTSYHGAYWATLLNRKVVVVNPFSSKFFHMRHAPTILFAPEDWRDAVDHASSYPDAYSECVDANLKFNDKVQNLIRTPH